MHLSNKTLAAIVSEHYQTASIFEKWHLDFCCKGKQTLAYACEQKGLDIQEIGKELDLVIFREKRREVHFDEMEVDQLIQYILLHHHFYVKQSIPQIHGFLEKIINKHGDRFPNMLRVQLLFRELAEELLPHLDKEEKILFPAIESLITRKETSVLLKQIIQRMFREHDNAGELMEEIRILTLDYTIPENVCTTFQITLSMLKDFESNLHKHVHLENNHLFPATMKMLA